MKPKNPENFLLFIMAELSQLSDPKEIIERFTGDVNNILSGYSLIYGEEKPPEGSIIFELDAIGEKYGYFYLSGDLSDFSDTFKNLLENSFKMLSIIIENTNNRVDLLQRNLSLETAVEVRTAHLNNAFEQISFQANLLDMVGQAVIAADKEGRITYWNAFAEKLYGWKFEEVIGRNISGIIVPESSPESVILIIQTLKRGEIWKGEFDITHKNGKVISVSVTNAPIYDINCEFDGIVCIANDVTDIKYLMNNLRESEESFRNLIENAPIGILVQADFTFAYANPAACKLLYAESSEQIIGHPILEFLAPEYHKIVSEKVSLLNNEQIIPPKVELSFIRIDGSGFDVEVTSSPLNYKGKNGSTLR